MALQRGSFAGVESLARLQFIRGAQRGYVALGD